MSYRWVRLTRRLAERVDGIDLSGRSVGDTVKLSQHDAELLIAEGWATPVFIERRRGHDRRGTPAESAPRHRG